MQTHKKTWEKPQLVVLARGTPEELVLTYCKNNDVPWAGPNYEIIHNHCADVADNCKGCKPEASGAS